MADPPRPSTFLEGDFNMVMDDQCQFHRDAKHTMRECKQLKRALGVPSELRRPRAPTTTTKTVISVSITVTVDLIDVITVTAGLTVAMMTGIDAIITATTTAMTDATTIVATITTTGVTTERVIAMMTSAMTTEMIGVMIDAVRTTTTATTTTARSDLNHHHLKGATIMVCFNKPTERSTSSSVAAKRPKATGNSDQTQGRSGTSTLKLHNLCIVRNSQSLSLGKIIGSTYQTPRTTRWSLTP
jgi:hypothetical protein